jgi:AraC-like DNA-binding protein
MSSRPAAVDDRGDQQQRTKSLMLNTDLHVVRPSVAVPAAELRSLSPVASAAGINLRDILRGLDLAPELLERARGTGIRLADYFRVLERVSLALHDEGCGLTARPLMLGATDLVLSKLSGCGSLPDVMRTVAHTYNILHGGPYNRVGVRSDRLTYVIDDTCFPYVSHADPARILFRRNCVLVFLHALLTLVTGDALAGSLRQVHTKSGRNGGRGFSAFWGVPIRWSSPFYALDYEPAAADLTVSGCRPPPSSRAVYRRMVEFAENELRVCPPSRSALSVVCDAFSENIYSESAVARRAGVSIATLRRRLQAAGLPAFRALRDRALNQAARTLLERRTSPSVIAEQLGFSDLRSFSRAFKRWNGLTPAAFARTRINSV